MLGACQLYNKACVSSQDKDICVYHALVSVCIRCLPTRLRGIGVMFSGTLEWIDSAMVVFYINHHGTQNYK